jgi:hypothetical protein
VIARPTQQERTGLLHGDEFIRDRSPWIRIRGRPGTAATPGTTITLEEHEHGLARARLRSGRDEKRVHEAIPGNSAPFKPRLRGVGPCLATGEHECRERDSGPGAPTDRHLDKPLRRK